MRIWNDLSKRGIPKDLIENCMEEEFVSDEKMQILDLLEKKNFSLDTADQNECRRIYQFLMRRGFRGSDIMSVMEQRYDSQNA